MCQRPWPELENKIQIMFKVGMGNVPRIPDNLSQEGQDFLKHCLQCRPEDRWTTSQLKGHLFVAVSISPSQCHLVTMQQVSGKLQFCRCQSSMTPELID